MECSKVPLGKDVSRLLDIVQKTDLEETLCGMVSKQKSAAGDGPWEVRHDECMSGCELRARIGGPGLNLAHCFSDGSPRCYSRA